MACACRLGIPGVIVPNTPTHLLGFRGALVTVNELFSQDPSSAPREPLVPVTAESHAMSLHAELQVVEQGI